MEVPLVEFQNIDLRAELKLPKLNHGPIFNPKEERKKTPAFSMSTSAGVKRIKLIKGI